MDNFNSYKIVDIFEADVAKITGSKYSVAVDSGTNAIFLCCKYLKVNEFDVPITIPSRTYPSVPACIINAGCRIKFKDYDWSSKRQYRLDPYPIFDASQMFEKDMYLNTKLENDQSIYQCISFSYGKKINIGKGGMILCDDLNAYNWFRKARYCGRNPVPLMEDDIDMLGWNMYMTPEQAARGIRILADPLKCEEFDVPDYPDLSKFTVYKNYL